MVPAPPPADAQARDAQRRGLSAALALASDRLLVVVEGGSPQSLVDAWRTLRAAVPDARALRHAPELLDLPSGSAALLRLLPWEAGWINANRGLLGARAWRLVVWVAAPGLDDLRRQAPDFFDWASHVWRIGPVPAVHAVTAVRAALAAETPVAWTGGELDPVLAALGLEVTRVSALAPWAELREAVARPGLRVVDDVIDGWTAARARWAEAEAARDGPPGRLPPIVPVVGPWPRGAVGVDGRSADLDVLQADEVAPALDMGLAPKSVEPPPAPDERPDDPVPRIEAILSRGGPTVEAVELALDLFHLEPAEAWTRALADGPTARLLDARRLRMAGRPREAEALLEGLPELTGDDRARWFLLRAEAHPELEGGWEEALAAAQTSDLRARVRLAWALRLWERGDPDAAERQAEAVTGWWSGAGALVRARAERLRGEPEEALRWLRGVALPEAERTGDTREVAQVFNAIADVLFEQGELDEVLRLYRDRVLPLFSRIGDQRGRASSLSGMADTFTARGEFDEALRLLREEVLPVVDQWDAPRDRAIATSKIADVMQARGELDEALRLRREEVLPVLERLGDQRGRVVTLGMIAEVLTVRGDSGEALRLLREEVLPVHERLGHARDRAMALLRVADALRMQGEDNLALATLRDVLPIVERLGYLRQRANILGRVAVLLQAGGDLDEALRIRREVELPIYERLGAERERAITVAGIADLLEARGEPEAARVSRDGALDIFRRLGDRMGAAAMQHALARGEWGAGNKRAALVRLQSVATDGLPDPWILLLGAERVSLLRDLGEHTEVVAVVSELLPLARADASRLALLTRAAADAHAALGHRGETIRWLREGAVPAAQAAGDRRALAAARLALASMLAEDPACSAEVRHLLKAARDGAEAAGLHDLAEQARARLRRRPGER